jgi:hypothetical protein
MGIIPSKCLTEWLPPVYRLQAWLVNKCAKFQSHNVYWRWKYLRWYANFNVNFKSKRGHNSIKMLFRVTSPKCTDWGLHCEHVCKVLKPYVKGLWKYLRWYANLNIIYRLGQNGEHVCNFNADADPSSGYYDISSFSNTHATSCPKGNKLVTGWAD